MHDQLGTTVHQTHDVLALRLAHAQGAFPTRERPRERFPATDRFLASTSRHVAAANTVLVPAAEDSDDGRERAVAFTDQSKRLEEALAHTKAKLYGSTYAVRRPWRDVWADVQVEFDAFWAEEDQLVGVLRTDLDRNVLAERLYRSELVAPTRPHPYIPHRGRSGRMARRVAVRVDRFWDTTEGRMIPEPVRPDPHREGRLTQYLLADPHIADD
ncbi:hypothetical protein [Nocardioides sambongensis]|uniref:hypothetical protein n=1 Tax=Nocardioides sambongensis TaxID=2589074 RepID=UPI00112BF223|nr:hypothetical protein [Nocardioides sambongensis]